MRFKYTFCKRSYYRSSIIDSSGRKVKTYPESTQVLEELHRKGYEMAVASRTSEIDGAHELVKLLNWDKFFKQMEIYPGNKTTHFQKYG